MMNRDAYKAAGRAYRALNPALEHLHNEELYAAMCEGTVAMDEGLAELQFRLQPIILKAGTAFFETMSWTADDVLQEGLITLWEIVSRRSYKELVPFDRFFAQCIANRFNTAFARLVVKTAVPFTNYRMGFEGREPIYMCGYGFHEKAEHYLERDRERSKRSNEKAKAKRAAERAANPPQPRPKQSAEEVKAKKREYYYAHAEEMNRRAKERRAAETPEQREARLARDRVRHAKRKARLAATA